MEVMAQSEGASLNRAPLFDGNDYVFWKVMMEAFIHSLDVRMWDVVITKYIVPAIVPTDANEKLKFELDKKARYALLCVSLEMYLPKSFIANQPMIYGLNLKLYIKEMIK